MKKPDLTKHLLIPKHVKLNDKETQDLLKRYNITLSNLPRKSKGDPALSSLSAKPGDVIKIFRKSPTAGEAIFYRVVTDA